ncbi:MAG TPA: galactokinase family protein [Blastocatellia bacterium]
MYRPYSYQKPYPPDVDRFIETINGLNPGGLNEGGPDLAASFFNRSFAIILTRAPGRLDVMGGIADYSGSLVLQMPISEATLVAIQMQSLPEISLLSLQGSDQPLEFKMPLDDLLKDGEPISYAEAQRIFKARAQDAWAAYVAGAFLVLMREKGLTLQVGARILIDSTVPQGKGVSSSAALEVAAMKAIAVCFERQIQPVEMALLCQKVENHIAGAPCGVMDQMTAVCGRQDALLALLCQPADLQESVVIPDGIEFWGIDSGIAHAVSGSDYTSVRVGAFMGHRMIAQFDGMNVLPGEPEGLVHIEDQKWGGYLARIAPSEFETRYSPLLPERISGAEFLANYQGTADQATRIDPYKSYAVRLPTRHPVYENFRTHAFRELLKHDPTESQRHLLGELMFQSHASYSACGLGSAGTDLLADLARKAGPAKGVYGARISGGGGGGTVVVLTGAGAEKSIAEIVSAYAAETGNTPYVFRGSSLGAAEFGWIPLHQWF